MRRRAVISLLAVLSLSGCAHPTAPVVGGLEGMQWIEVEGDEPKLAFGVPNSDVIVLMMSCAPRSGEVDVAFFADPNARGRTVQLRSGLARTQLRTSGAPGHHDPTAALVLEGQTRASAPVLASFARTGALAVGVGQATPRELPAADPNTARRFVGSCER